MMVARIACLAAEDAQARYSGITIRRCANSDSSAAQLAIFEEDSDLAL
jgi:hypothetical protein